MYIAIIITTVHLLVHAMHVYSHYCYHSSFIHAELCMYMAIRVTIVNYVFL